MIELLLIELWGLLFSGSTYDYDYWLMDEDELW